MKMTLTPIFFNPDTTLVDWLIKYAKNRILIDVGAGSHFHLTKLLHGRGYRKLVAIEPNADYSDFMRAKQELQCMAGMPFHFMNQEVEKQAPLLNTEHQEVLAIIARPCHGSFIENTIALKGKKTEVLYITKPENMEHYNDLGRFKSQAKLIKPKGTSQDNEVFYSIK